MFCDTFIRVYRQYLQNIVCFVLIGNMAVSYTEVKCTEYISKKGYPVLEIHANLSITLLIVLSTFLNITHFKIIN